MTLRGEIALNDQEQRFHVALISGRMGVTQLYVISLWRF